mgnify:CR=1 FL=1
MLEMITVSIIRMMFTTAVNRRFGLKRRRVSIRLAQPIPTIETYRDSLMERGLPLICLELAIELRQKLFRIVFRCFNKLVYANNLASNAHLKQYCRQTHMIINAIWQLGGKMDP